MSASSALRPVWQKTAPVESVAVGTLKTQHGLTIENARLGFCCFGTDRSNPIVVLHPALTGSPRASLTGAGPTIKPSQGDGWWDRIIGEGKLLDPYRFTIVVIDHLGGTGHSTGGAELWELRSSLTFRDSVQLAVAGLRRLGIRKVHAVIGGSIGGGQALQWLFQNSIEVGKILDLSGSGGQSLRTSDFFEIQADILEPLASGEHLASRLEQNLSDLTGRTPHFDYLASSVSAELKALLPTADRAIALSLARKVGFLRFVAPPFYAARAARLNSSIATSFDALVSVRRWLDEQGESFVRRFSAEALGVLCRMNVTTSPLTPMEVAHSLIERSTQLLSFSVHGDTLFPALHHLDFFSRVRDALGSEHSHLLTTHYAYDEVYGHDHFLTERFSQECAQLRTWLDTSTVNSSGSRRLQLSRSGGTDHAAHLHDLDVRAWESGRV